MMMATYRPHNSPLMEWVQTRGRMRSNKAMISRNNLRVWSAPPEERRSRLVCTRSDYGRKGSSFAPFLRLKCRHHQRHVRDFASVRRRNADRDNGKKG